MTAGWAPAGQADKIPRGKHRARRSQRRAEDFNDKAMEPAYRNIAADGTHFFAGSQNAGNNGSGRTSGKDDLEEGRRGVDLGGAGGRQGVGDAEVGGFAAAAVEGGALDVGALGIGGTAES